RPLHTVALVEKVDLLHFPPAVVLADVPVVGDHLRLAMAEPLLDLCLRRAVQKGPAAEVMPKSVQPPMGEADLARRGGKLLFQLANDFAAGGCGILAMELRRA